MSFLAPRGEMGRLDRLGLVRRHLGAQDWEKEPFEELANGLQFDELASRASIGGFVAIICCFPVA